MISDEMNFIDPRGEARQLQRRGVEGYVEE